MKSIITLIVAIVLNLSPLTSTVLAMTYYIDYVSGSDSNNGTSMGAAWQHVPGDPRAMGNVASAVLSGGDTVIFKGGVTYITPTTGNCRIDLNWSGTSDSSRIIYDGNSAGIFGSGKAILTSNNDTGACTAWRAFYASNAKSNITIQNFEFYDIGGYAATPPPTGCSITSGGKNGSGISFTAGGSNITVKDNYFHEIGEWHNQDPLTSGSIEGGGLGFKNMGGNVVAENNEFTKVSVAMGIYATGNNSINGITIRNNNIHNYIRWGIDIAPQGNNATFQNINIHNNKIHDYTEFDQGNWGGCGEWPHTDGIFVRSDYSGITWNNINIYNNEFYDTGTVGGGTASIYITEGPSVNVYNNTFAGVLHGRVILVNNTVSASGTPTLRFYNNTFYGKTNFLGFDGAYLAQGIVSVKNNIFYSTATDASQTAPIYISYSISNNIIDELDYNLYYNPNSTRAMKQQGSTFWTFSQIQSCTTVSGCTNWETYGMNSDPKFVNISYGLGQNVTLNNYRLQSVSPAENAGVDLSQYFTIDKNGLIRPTGAAWTIGAFEIKYPMPPVLQILE